MPDLNKTCSPWDIEEKYDTITNNADKLKASINIDAVIHAKGIPTIFLMFYNILIMAH